MPQNFKELVEAELLPQIWQVSPNPNRMGSIPLPGTWPSSEHSSTRSISTQALDVDTLYYTALETLSAGGDGGMCNVLTKLMTEMNRSLTVPLNGEQSLIEKMDWWKAEMDRAVDASMPYGPERSMASDRHYYVARRFSRKIPYETGRDKIRAELSLKLDEEARCGSSMAGVIHASVVFDGQPVGVMRVCQASIGMPKLDCVLDGVFNLEPSWVLEASVTVTETDDASVLKRRLPPYLVVARNTFIGTLNRKLNAAGLWSTKWYPDCPIRLRCEVS
jgi:hypothetical protein